MEWRRKELLRNSDADIAGSSPASPTQGFMESLPLVLGHFELAPAESLGRGID